MSEERIISFVKYFHDDCNVDENIESFNDEVDRGKIVVPDSVSPEELATALDKVFSERPFYEIGFRVELNLDTSKLRIVGIEE